MHRAMLKPSRIQSESQNSFQDPLLAEADGTPSKSKRSHCTKWPASASSLRESSPSTLLRLLPNILLLLIPSVFYVLGIFVLRLNGELQKPGYDIGDTVIQAVKIASTLWPILFAAVFGAMLKAITLYYAERGTNLGTLEVLATSQSLVSTVRGCFSHRIIGIWTAVIIIIWTLSPLGGQAVLRSLEPKVQKQSHDYPLRYYPSDKIQACIDGSPFSSASGSTSSRGMLHRAVDAAISAPDVAALFPNRSSPEFKTAVERLGGEERAAESAQADLWGNVRIPFLHLMPGYNESERNNWIDISTATVAPYSSLIGHTIRGVPQSSIGNSSLSLRTAHHTLSCTPWFNGTQWLQHNPGSLQMHKFTNDSIFTENPNSGEYPNIFFDLLTTQARPPVHPTSPETSIGKTVLVFGARWDMSEAFTQIRMSHCEVTAIYVETAVQCTRASVSGALSCAASRIRATPDMPLSNWSAFNLVYSWAGNVLMAIPDTIQSGHVAQPSGLELFLENPAKSFHDTGFLPLAYQDIPMDIFQARLAFILNTYYQASMTTSNFLGADGVALYDVPSIAVLQYGNATGTWTEFTPPRYEVQPTWLTLYLVSTTVLAVCAIAGVVISALTRAPDLFCGVSSLTRDSVFMTRVPEGGSSLSASDRARHLQDVWVRIQDVKPEDDVGRIAFSDQKELRATAGLRWERKYE